MGRSVSTPIRCTATCYGYLCDRKYECTSCSERFDDHGTKSVSEDDGYSEATVKICPHCGADKDETQEIDHQWEFDCILNDIRCTMADAFKSLSVCNTWLDREDHAILENRYCHIGISEYCGAVAVWLVAKDGPWWGNAGWEAMRDRWLDSIKPRFEKLANSILPGAMVRIGGFSDGTSVYRRIAA